MNQNKPLNNQTIYKEIEQVKNTGLNCHKYAFFSKNDFNEDIDESIYDLDDLFK